MTSGFRFNDVIDRPVFNSLTDHPQLGDERIFMCVRQVGEAEWKRDIDVIPGREYEVAIRYRNDASEKFNSAEFNGMGIARGTAVYVDMPANASEDAFLNVRISAENTDLGCFDSIRLKATDGSMPAINYVNGSAVIHNQGMSNGAQLPASMFSWGGALIGVNALDGIVPGGDAYSGYISFNFWAGDMPAAYGAAFGAAAGPASGAADAQAAAAYTDLVNAIRAIPGAQPGTSAPSAQPSSQFGTSAPGTSAPSAQPAAPAPSPSTKPDSNSSKAKTTTSSEDDKNAAKGCLIVIIIIIVWGFLIYLVDRPKDNKHEHEHKWKEATYDEPKTCTECGETEGEVKGYINTFPGKYLDEQVSIGYWNSDAYEFDPPLEQCRWIEINTKITEVEGIDLPATFKIYARRNGEWNYYWTLYVDELNKEYIYKYNTEGSTIEALALVPEGEAGDYSTFSYIMKPVSAQLTED